MGRWPGGIVSSCFALDAPRGFTLFHDALAMHVDQLLALPLGCRFLDVKRIGIENDTVIVARGRN